MKEIYKSAIQAAIAGGNEIMEIYEKDDFQIESKEDDSPLTIADKKANDIINDTLKPLGVPIISEENRQLSYEARKKWESCWIVDPLDGTKEFIKRNGEFTVNIAFVENERPVFGVIYVPAKKEIYIGDVRKGKSFKGIVDGKSTVGNQLKEIKPSVPGEQLKVVGSRSHMNQDTRDYIELLKSKYKKEVEVVSKGSSLKFCLIAEGLADVYPRFAPTMEWDTAAGQAICKAVGLEVIDQKTGEEMQYNRENLLNNYFLVSNLG